MERARGGQEPTLERARGWEIGSPSLGFVLWLVLTILGLGPGRSSGGFGEEQKERREWALWSGMWRVLACGELEQALDGRIRILHINEEPFKSRT